MTLNLIECLGAAAAAAEAAATLSEGGASMLKAGGGAPLNDFSTCLTAWMVKRRTNFYDSDTLDLPWYFGALCWSYFIGGLMMFYTRPSWTRTSRFPFRAMALGLMLIQSPMSFVADYVHMTNDTIFHAVDRFIACPMLLLELGKIATMFPHVRTSTFSLYLASIIFAVYSFLKSSNAQDVYDEDDFVFWHNCWHIYPLLVSVIMGFDFFVLGEYDKQREGLKLAGRDNVHGPLYFFALEQARAAAGTKEIATPTTPLRRSQRLRLRGVDAAAKRSV